MEKVYIDLILVNKGIYVDTDEKGNETMPETVTVTDKTTGKTFSYSQKNIIPVKVANKIVWGFTPVEGKPYIYLRNRYQKANIWSLFFHADAIKKAVIANAKKPTFVQKYKEGKLDVIFHFINRQIVDGEEIVYQFNTNTYFPKPESATFVDNVKSHCDYITTMDMWGKSRLKAVIHNKKDNAIDQMIRGTLLSQLGNGENIDDIQAKSKLVDNNIVQYYNDLKHDLKTLINNISSITHKEEVEEEVKDDLSNLIYYRTWWQVDYKPFEYHFPKSFKYLIPRSTRESKYLDLHFDLDDKDAVLDAKVYNPVWKKDAESPTIEDYNVSELHEKGVTVTPLKNVTVKSRWIYQGKYYMLSMGDVILNPVNKYNAAAAMVDAEKIDYHCEFNDYSWISQYVGACHEKYTDKEIVEILKYSVCGEYSMLELNMSASNAMYKIRRDLTMLNRYHYTGECWYKLIRDQRILVDLDVNNGDDDDDDNKAIVFKNDIDILIATYPECYRKIGDEEYLVFQVK